MEQIHSFPPVLNTHTRVLVIGSMPGIASLQAQQYYAHKYNQFWPIIFDVFEAGRPPKNYEDKLCTLLKHRIGLWDTLSACTRPGSLDSHIQTPVPNDFPALFKRYPAVHTLLFNGQAAATYFKRFYGWQLPGKMLVVLPSTSPAHASLSYATKLTRWKKILLQSLSEKIHT